MGGIDVDQAMADEDRYRRPTWTQEDKSEFFLRWRRSRSPSTKTQYLRIQAETLRKNCLPREAAELLTQLLDEFPDDYFRGMSLVSRAQCHIAAGNFEAAANDYRSAITVQSECPNVHTNAWLEFPWMIVEHQLLNWYGEAIAILEEGESACSAAITLPATIFMAEAVKAVISHELGDHQLARVHARHAMAAAVKDHSGLRYHPRLGLVGEELKGSFTWSQIKQLLKDSSYA